MKEFTLLIFVTSLAHAQVTINVNLASRGRVFEGIGGISGGGATSRMLPLYPEPQRSEILDYIFKPGYGASLQHFKVEIPGDDQTTQGVESSHRHYEWESGNFQRGYEFWMIQQAKTRNPNITLYGLPYSFPGWLGNGSHFVPYADVNKLANYVVGWVLGAKQVWGYDIDFLGVWNEKPEYVPYIKALYDTLKAHGLENKTKIAAGDNHWEIIDHIEQDPTLKSIIGKIAIHYPGGYSPARAQSLNISLWSSEDDSTDTWLSKPGCIARIINRNYVTGLFTSTYIYNIASAFYDNLDYPRTGMLTANQPWSGWYSIDEPIWMAAHTTQFTQPGWYYLAHDKGVGMLLGGGGSYVTLISPDGQNFTIVIETIDFYKSACVRPGIGPYPTVRNQTLKFSLANYKFQNPPKLYVRFSDLTTGEMFVRKADIQVNNDMSFRVAVAANQLITLTTVSPGQKGGFETDKQNIGGPGTNQPFPYPYADDFESTPVDSEGRYMQQQAGVFEVQQSNDPAHGNVLQQMLLQAPVTWCPVPNLRPINVFGNWNWTNISYSADIFVPSINGTTGAFIGARIEHGGCWTLTTPGIFVWVDYQKNLVAVTERLMGIKNTCEAQIALQKNAWYNLGMSVSGSQVNVLVNGQKVLDNCQLNQEAKDLKSGFVGLGTKDFSFAWFDNIKVNDPLKDQLDDVRRR